MKKKILIASLIVSLIVFVFLFIQRPSEHIDYDPNHPLVGASCGGDWSYDVECPPGTYCKDLGKGPLAGGICTPIGE